MSKSSNPFTKLLEPLALLPDSFILGVSGGIDSVSLLHALAESGHHPAVVHFNHGWRRESRTEAMWVGNLVKSYGLKFYSGKAKAGIVIKRREATAREARFTFFGQVAAKVGTKALVLAHHADDQVETFLMQLLRGSGSAAGMASVTEREGMVIYRPWLNVWRKEILTYAKVKKLKWCEDPSNQDISYRRNQLRHQIIPYLQKKLGFALVENLWRAAEIRQAENQWLESLCRDSAQQNTLDVKKLRQASLAEQRRVLWYWLAYHQISDVGFEDVELVRGLLEKKLPARVNLSKGRFARRRQGVLFLE